MGYSPVTIPSITPQYTTEEQDVTGRSGTALAGSILTGQHYSTNVTTTGNPTLTSLIAGSIAVTATGGPSPSGPYYVNSGNALNQISVGTSGGRAILSYTGSTSTTYTGLAIVSGTGSWTIPVGASVFGSANIIPDVQVGASVTRGIGSTLGVTDWGTVLGNVENTLCGLTPQQYGFVPCVYSDVYGESIQWGTNTGTGSIATTLGSPMVLNAGGIGTVTITAVSGSGTIVTATASNGFLAGQTVTLGGFSGAWTGLNGQTVTVLSTGLSSSQFEFTNSTTGTTSAGTATAPYQPLPSSLLVTSASTIPADTRSFRRVILFFQKQTNGDGITFATTGVVSSSGKLDTNGSGLACWDSGDLGYNLAGTGFTATWGTHSSGSGGAGVVLIGALYIQSAGNCGSINVNISHSGNETGDYSNATTQLSTFIQFLTANGLTPRRFITGDMSGTDSLNGTALTTVISNLSTFLAALKTASPQSEVVMMGVWNIGTAGVPGVGNATWAGTWLPAIQAQAVASGVTFVDLYSRFGDCSYTGINGVTGEPQLTVDNVHFGVNLGGSGINSIGGLNGQEAMAETFFEKLEYSKEIAVSGTTQTGLASDGKSAIQIGGGSVFGSPVQQMGIYANATDGVPAAALFHANSGSIFPAGLYLGTAGAAYDTALVRTAAATVALTTGTSTNGAGILQAGSNTAKAVTIASILGSISSNTKFQLSGSGSGLVTTANQDCMLYFQCGASATVAISMGPSTGQENSIFASATSVSKTEMTLRVPSGWFVYATFTSADVAQVIGQTC